MRFLTIVLTMLVFVCSSCDKDETVYMTDSYVWLKSETGLSHIIVKSDVKNIKYL